MKQKLFFIYFWVSRQRLTDTKGFTSHIPACFEGGGNFKNKKGKDMMGTILDPLFMVLHKFPINPMK